MGSDVLCLSLKEQAGDFPPRCALPRGHTGKHKSVATHWIAGKGTHFSEEWEDLTQCSEVG